MKKLLFCKVVMFGSLFLIGCGREAAPFPPEVVSPKAVDTIQTKATDKQLTINWLAPTTNLRGKKLTELRGYRIYKTALAEGSKIEELENSDFSLFTTISDNTMQRLEKKKAEAKANGKAATRVSLDDSERLISFTDRNVAAGKTYVYRIAPYNHTWVDGAVPQIVKVVFKGTNSEVAVLDNQIGLQDLEDSQEFLQPE